MSHLRPRTFGVTLLGFAAIINGVKNESDISFG
jgi:hypothetical protein